MYGCVEHCERMAINEQWIFTKENNISSNQAINDYSNEVKNKYVQFGSFASLRTVTAHVLYGFLNKKCIGEIFGSMSVKHLRKLIMIYGSSRITNN